MTGRKHWLIMADVLRNRPHKVGAEIGVFRGLFAEHVLKLLPGIKTYYCVDPWQHYEDYKKMLGANSKELSIPQSVVYKTFINKTNRWKDKRIILRMMSQEALVKVPDSSLDWVFIDANHTYKYAREDIIGWSKKVKIGGVISGHDFYDPWSKRQGFEREIPFGVGRAVREIVPKFEVEFVTWWAIKESEGWIKE